MDEQWTVIARIPERVRRLQRVDGETEPGQVRYTMDLPDGPPAHMSFAFGRPLPQKLSAPVDLTFKEEGRLVMVDPEKREALYELEE